MSKDIKLGTNILLGVAKITVNDAVDAQTEHKFYDTTDANATAGDIRNGKTGYVNGVKVTGTIPNKSAQTYTPTTSDQTIASGQYLSGTQTIKGDANLVSGNIKKNVTLFGVTGTVEEGITPTGTYTATANGTYNVTNYATCVVAIPVYDGTVV